MPNSQQHRDKAIHNKDFLGTITVQKHPDWAVAAAFYVAVHLVERLRTLLPKQTDQHSKDHQDRLQFVQGHHRPIHTEYHQLFNASIIARYQTVNRFNRQFSPGSVQATLIDTYLAAIETYVAARFPPSPPPPLPAAAATGT